ncbi:cytochrome c oxidase subunit 3 [Pseudoduganella ginsengisoli]|uniref:Bb3-type cytochrome oxidase subunit III n=1 Tax=Pseudoduganella ginsengisoli TaxID=1462440 RepID=A0A6L6PYY7_9BURK|nr:bb3-type cytochrome oxidase subunit III [Pseudoduganella ginsengisoli]MTW02351.1 bb3-type cytochrome oxidase subunit III [Pseudoduganella ginsengisoli]
MNTLVHAAGSAVLPAATYAARRAGLWVFLGVVTSLFLLFGVAYVMRMAAADWQPLRYVPWQLWLSTGLLAAACIAWETARRHAHDAGGRRAGVAGCVLSVAFLCAQWWSWQAMMDMQYRVDGNPADSFFFMLTGLHGLHVMGGLLAAALAARALVQGEAMGGLARYRLAGTIALCAQYWHYLLGLWLVLFALLFWVTPDVVQAVCDSVGLRPPQSR